MPDTEVKELEENKIEIKTAEEQFILIAHKEETKQIWLKEINQYTSDVIAHQEHLLDDLKIDPKQHIDTQEPVFKLPQRIEAYEPNQNIKPSDFAEDYTVSKYSATKATEEIKTKTIVSQNLGEANNDSGHSQETVEGKTLKPSIKEQSKIPIPKKAQTEEKSHLKIETERVELPEKLERISCEQLNSVKVAENPEKIKQENIQENLKLKEKVEDKPKALAEFKTEIVRKTPVVLQSTLDLPVIERVKVENSKENFVEPIIKTDVKQAACELFEVEASVSEKLDRLSQKLRAIRKTDTENVEIKLISEENNLSQSKRTEEEQRKQEAIRESIQEKLEEDYISDNSVIRRIEERYKRNYKDKDIKTLTKRKASTDLEETLKVTTVVNVDDTLSKDQPPAVIANSVDSKASKPVLKLEVLKDENLTDSKPKVTKAADSNNSEPTQQQSQQSSSKGEDSAHSESDQINSSNNRRHQSGDSRKPDREQSPPSPGAIRLPGFFDPPPPTQYETSVEIHVKKEKYPDPPPIITRKVVVKNEELEKKTEEFLRGEIPYEKEDYSLGAAHKKIKNLKHNLGKTGENIKFAEDTYSKARVGDFKNIKTPGTVVGERKKEPVFEYQYTVEDPKTGLCITTSESVDFEDAEEELKKLAIMDADHQNKITKRVEGEIDCSIIKKSFSEFSQNHKTFTTKFLVFKHLQIICMR